MVVSIRKKPLFLKDTHKQGEAERRSSENPQMPGTDLGPYDKQISEKANILIYP